MSTPKAIKSAGVKFIGHRHHNTDDGSVCSLVTHSSYESSYTAQSRKAVQSMKLSNIAVDIKKRIQIDNMHMDGVLEGISAMTNFLSGVEHKHSSLDDLASSRINLDDCLRLKREIREKIQKSKREKRRDIFTSDNVITHSEFLGNEMFSLSSHGLYSSGDVVAKPHAPGLFLTDDDRSFDDMSMSISSMPQGTERSQKLHTLQKKQYRQASQPPPPPRQPPHLPSRRSLPPSPPPAYTPAPP